MKSEKKFSENRPEKEIYDLVSLLSASGFDADLDSNGPESHLSKAVQRLKELAEFLSIWNVQQDETEERLNQILDTIVAISSLDFRHKAEIGEAGDIFDAVAEGLNALAEELEFSTVSHEFLDNILESMVDSLIVLDKDANIRMVNQSALDLLGYTAEELIGQPIDVVILDNEIKNFTPKEFNKIAFIRDKEIQFINKYGIKIPVYYSFSVMRDKNGIFSGAVCVGHDITLRKETEEERNKWAYIFEHVQSGVAVDNEGNGIIDMVNPAFAAMLGYEPNEMVGMPVIEVYTPEFRQELAGIIKKVHKEGSSIFEAKQLTKDGSELSSLVNATIVKDDDNNILYRVDSVTDISEQKKTENALRESETRYRTLFEQSPFGVMLVDPQSAQVIEFNDAMASMLNYSSKEFSKIKIGDIEVLESREELKQQIDKILHTGEDEFESKLRTSNGDFRDVVVNVQTIEISGEKVFLSIVRDITESKRTNEQIKASLAEKEVLLKEVHHRVKNNLQIISSLLYLQGRKVSDKNAKKLIQGSQDRIKAMSLIHEKLYQSANFANIDMQEYILSLMQSLFTTYGVNNEKINFQVKVDDIVLSVDTAVPCGMIINELVSNSLKYAFPNGNNGKIVIEVSQTDSNRCNLRVMDNGIGFPKDVDYRDTESLGLQLVNKLVGQINGEYSLEKVDKGTAFLISFDLSEDKETDDD